MDTNNAVLSKPLTEGSGAEIQKAGNTPVVGEGPGAGHWLH